MRSSTPAVTIGDIAKKVGISKSTVSYALNGGPRQVSPAIKSQVLETARELGFRPNPVALSLASGRTNTIGFVPSSLEADAMVNPLAQVALQSIYRAAHDQGMHVLLPSGFDPRRSEETKDNLYAAPVDGLIVLLPDDVKAVSVLSDRGVPMVGIISPFSGKFPTVNADNAVGVRSAVEHLVQLGHRKIDLLFNEFHFDTSIRHLAFIDAVEKIGLKAEDCRTFVTGLTENSGYLAAYRLLSNFDRPTAIVAVNDHVAAGCMRAAYDLGIRVPDQLSVVGFDDDQIGRNTMIPLTTVRQPIVEMAQAAFQGILDQLAGETVADLMIPCTLVVRQSTAPPLRP